MLIFERSCPVPEVCLSLAIDGLNFQKGGSMLHVQVYYSMLPEKYVDIIFLLSVVLYPCSLSSSVAQACCHGTCMKHSKRPYSHKLEVLIPKIRLCALKAINSLSG